MEEGAMAMAAGAVMAMERAVDATSWAAVRGAAAVMGGVMAPAPLESGP